MIDTLCHFCAKPITSLNDCLVLNDHFAKWPEAFFSHADCCDERDPFPLTYGVHLSRISALGNPNNPHEGGCESFWGWHVHLSEKNWITLPMLYALKDAHLLAKQIRAKRASAPAKASPVRDARQRVTPKLRLYVFARDGHQCCRCGAPPPLELDHIVPVSKGGSSDKSNLQSLCVRCNRAKRDRVETQETTAV